MTAFDDLEQHYPEIIAQMKPRFNAHTFILKLAYEYQSLYINALMHCVHRPKPFQAVHKQLAAMLDKFPELIQHTVHDDDPSTDIFGHDSHSSVWYKR